MLRRPDTVKLMVVFTTEQAAGLAAEARKRSTPDQALNRQDIVRGLVADWLKKTEAVNGS